MVARTKKKQCKCVPAQATIAKALPERLAEAEKSTFALNVSSLAMWVCILELKNIFQWHFASLRSTTCVLPAILKAES